ncbi:hypothetical protein KY290_017237 [Solanum tuberosum]|uniref:Uncharacterized protein n=1 Tax=Solanum tuberosum TaxID=4113 RepID=A0ABQ7VAQ7_SOLTU|nr:hypothetical protein KY284_016263 [Solanum tuberosum]KAH0701995.1 hypothetical protein KY285_016273 [Solanum tuberosum]KAH0761164.1 hypothetical protein KY290_017237 [Solanum tuberosum]
MAYYPSDRMKDQVILSPTTADQWYPTLPIRQNDQTTPYQARKINFSTAPTPYNMTKGQSYNILNLKIVNK